MKKQVGTGIMPGAVSFLSAGTPWGFGNVAQLANGLSDPTQELHRMEDEEINANADHECEVLGKCRSRGTEYNLPNSVNGLGAGPNNPTDLERMALELEEAENIDLREVGITTQRQPGSMTQRQPIDGSYFDLPGTPKRMWHVDPQNHIPEDPNEPNNVEHYDEWLDDILNDEPLGLARNLEKGSPSDWKSTTPEKRGRLFMAPGQQNQMVVDDPKRRLGGSVKEQADMSRWYTRTASARAVPDLETDSIRQETEPLLLGDPELDDDVVEMSVASTSYLVKPQRWVKKEKDTDVRILETTGNKVMKITKEQLEGIVKSIVERKLNEGRLNEWNSVVRKLEPFISSWVKAGKKEALRSLGEMFEIVLDEGCDTSQAIALISQNAHDQATNALERTRANKLQHFLSGLADEEKVQRRWMR